MRLFAGIPVAEPAYGALGGLLEGWRSTDWPVKWVRQDGLHLTLKFLGSVETERVATIRDALAAAVQGTPALSFALTEVGAFPTVSRARILIAGLESEAPLELLVHRIERACADLGFPVEGRPFRPHLTLGRVREGRRLPEPAVRAIEGAELPAASFMAERVVLYQSLPGPGGSRYEERATFPLGTG